MEERPVLDRDKKYLEGVTEGSKVIMYGYAVGHSRVKITCVSLAVIFAGGVQFNKHSGRSLTQIDGVWLYLLKPYIRT